MAYSQQRYPWSPGSSELVLWSSRRRAPAAAFSCLPPRPVLVEQNTIHPTAPLPCSRSSLPQPSELLSSSQLPRVKSSPCSPQLPPLPSPALSSHADSREHSPVGPKGIWRRPGGRGREGGEGGSEGSAGTCGPKYLSPSRVLVMTLLKCRSVSKTLLIRMQLCWECSLVQDDE